MSKAIDAIPVRNLYYHIQNHSMNIGEADLSQILNKSRLDPRLMEVTTEFIRDFWWNIDPIKLNKSLKRSKSPFAIKPAVAAILEYCQFEEDVKQNFFYWANLAVRGIKDPSPQLFYIGINKIGSKSMMREESEGLHCFLRHNLLSKDLPFNKGIAGKVKTPSDLMGTRIDEIQLMKSKYAHKIREFKKTNNLSNKAITEKLSISRTFLSKILNNHLEGITVEYLAQKSAVIRTQAKRCI